MVAFKDCTSLNPIIVPDNVALIAMDAFENVPHVYYNGPSQGYDWGADALN